MRTARWLLAAALALALGAAAVRAEPAAAPDTADDEKLLKEAGVKADGPALVEYLRKRVPAEAAPEKIAALIKQLGDDDFESREKATTALKALGARALPELRRAATSPDPETRRRAQECVEAVVSGPGAARTAAAARVLATRKPAGAAAALVGYLPFAEDAEAAEEVVGALVAVGAPGGKVDAAVAGALADKSPGPRAVAALLLGRYGSAEQKAAVRKLLADADPAVRLRAAQGLLAGREKAAVPVLLALLAEAPGEVARPAEDLLGRAAGDKAPPVGFGEGKADRAKCAAAWKAWWKDNEGKIDLTKADVDLQVVNPSRLARDTVRRLLEAWFVKADVAAVKRLTDVPFTLMGQEKQDTREKMDKFIQEIAERAKERKAKTTVLDVMTGDEYARRVKGHPEGAKALAGLRTTDLRVVISQLEEANGGARKEQFGFFVRVSGGRARVIGIGPPPEDGRKPPAKPGGDK